MTARVRCVALAVAVAGAVAGAAVAQEGQPIYPAYDGFLKNPDGSFTLAFAYFSHNASLVTIPAGAGNQFGPEPGDRMQPTVFKPGHWRFQCVMVVGPEFDGKLRWTLSYAGSTTGTSERMLQSNWNLVEGAAELAKLDYAKAPRGVCLNRPPTVRLLGSIARRGSAPELSAKLGEDLQLFGSVHDEGLPRGRTLTAGWTKVSGPGEVTFTPVDAEHVYSAPGSRTRARFTAPGRYELELSATDSEFTERLRVVVNVE
jgi:hypothetical protein